MDRWIDNYTYIDDRKMIIYNRNRSMFILFFELCDCLHFMIFPLINNIDILLGKHKE